jgi:aspartate/methionine/tyrosine aminotransferase
MEPESIGGLSRRGAQMAAHSPMPEYLTEHFARSGSQWHPNDNPEGYVALCIAENKLMADLVLPQLTRTTTPPESVLSYDAMVGSEAFRGQLAEFMERTFLGRRFAPEQIAVSAGAGTVLENVFHALADPGDAVLVPTPSYAGFWLDLETRDELHIVPVHCDSEDGFRLTTERLDAALATTGRPVKALLFTNPDNPKGTVATADEITDVLRWAEAHDLHVVFDEIYALSVFGDTPLESIASLRPNLGDHIHIVWAFSKDFGASGLRCGLLVSENESLLAAVDGLAYWGAASGHTQWVLGQMITDHAWIDRYCAELRQRLRSTHARVSEALREAGIPHLDSDAGIFVLCDMRGFMDDLTWEEEHALWRKFLEQGSVNITPGAACRISEPGFFRLCYAAEPIEAVLSGIARIKRTLVGLRP